MKLPLIHSTRTSSHSLLKKNYRIIPNTCPSREIKFDSFSKKINEIKEIKIYLDNNFNAFDVDESFIKDMELEYAEQYLYKLEILPTSSLIRRLLSLRPIEKCDFYLTNEDIITNGVRKSTKIIHILPNFSIKNQQNNIKSYSPKNFENQIKFKTLDKELKEKIISIKKNN